MARLRGDPLPPPSFLFVFQTANNRVEQNDRQKTKERGRDKKEVTQVGVIGNFSTSVAIRSPSHFSKETAPVSVHAETLQPSIPSPA
jgi:hypothetical protein